MSGELSFSAAELAGLQAAQQAHMMDTCTVDVYTDAGADAYNNPNPSWVSGSALACGFMATKDDEGNAAGDVPVRDARLRLPIATVITSKDRITITKRHGVSITPVTYGVVGTPQRGPSGLVVALELVTDGS